MTHRFTLHLRGLVTQPSGCFPPCLFPFEFPISHSVFHAPNPGWCFPSSLISCLLKCCHLIGSSVPKIFLKLIWCTSYIWIACKFCVLFVVNIFSFFISSDNFSNAQSKFLQMFSFEVTALVELYFWSNLIAFGFKDDIKCFSSTLRRQLPLF